MPYPIPEFTFNQLVGSTDLNTYLRDNLTFLFNNDLTFFGTSPSSSPPSGLNGTMKQYVFRVEPSSGSRTFYRLVLMYINEPVIALVRRGTKVQRYLFNTRTGAGTTPQIVMPEYTVGEETGAAALAIVYESLSTVWVGLFLKPSDPSAGSGVYEIIMFADKNAVLTALEEPEPVEVPFGTKKFMWSKAPETALFGHTTHVNASAGELQLAVPLRDVSETDVEGEFGFASISGYITGSQNGDMYMSFTGDPNNEKGWLVRSVYVDGTTYTQTSSGNGATPAIINRTRAGYPCSFRIFLWRLSFDIFASVYSTYITAGNPSLFLSVARLKIQSNGGYNTLYITPSLGFVTHGTATAMCVNW